MVHHRNQAEQPDLCSGDTLFIPIPGCHQQWTQEGARGYVEGSASFNDLSASKGQPRQARLYSDKAMKGDLSSAGERRPWANGMGQISQRCRWYPLCQRFRIECTLREGAHTGNLLVFESSIPFMECKFWNYMGVIPKFTSGPPEHCVLLFLLTRSSSAK